MMRRLTIDIGVVDQEPEFEFAVSAGGDDHGRVVLPGTELEAVDLVLVGHVHTSIEHKPEGKHRNMSVDDGSDNTRYCTDSCGSKDDDGDNNIQYSKR